MVSVLLTVLKILGIAILAVLGLVLIILLLVLFAPVRYRAKGMYNGNDEKSIMIRMGASWLLHILSLKADYVNGNALHIVLKLFGIRLYDNLKKPKTKEKDSKKDSKKETKENVEIQAASLPESDEDNNECGDEYSGEETREYVKDDLNAQNNENVFEDVNKPHCKEKNSVFIKISKFFKNIKFTFRRICDTIIKIRDNLKYYIKLMQLESTQRAFISCKEQLFNALKMILPKKFNVNLHLGFDDPSAMGEVLAVWGMFYPWHLGRIDIHPEFDKAVMEGDFSLKGRVSAFVIVKAAFILYYDKDIRLLIKRVKRGVEN
jgi:hypothetical protein